MINAILEHRYTPGTSFYWKGRDDGEGKTRIHQAIEKVDLNKGLPKASTQNTIALVGFPTDEGIKRNQGRPGAIRGPQELRTSLANLAYSRADNTKIIDVGDILCNDGRLSQAQEILGTVVTMLINENIHPVVMGGGHEISWGSYLGIAGAYPTSDLAIINFDAHYDLRPLEPGGKGTSGTCFSQIYDDRTRTNQSFNYHCFGVQRYGNTKSLLQKADHLNVHTIFADDILCHGSKILEDAVEDIIHRHDKIYVTICLDVFNACCSPGVSAPQPFGILPWHILPALRRLAASGKVVCIDVAELSPIHDVNNMTSNLAASIICDYLHHMP